MTNDQRFDQITYLMGYFHQDWKCDFASDKELIEQFSYENGEEIVINCEKQLSELIRSSKTNSEIIDLLEEQLQGNHLPYEDVRVWLEQITMQMRQVLAIRSQEK